MFLKIIYFVYTLSCCLETQTFINGIEGDCLKIKNKLIFFDCGEDNNKKTGIEIHFITHCTMKDS